MSEDSADASTPRAPLSPQAPQAPWSPQAPLFQPAAPSQPPPLPQPAPPSQPSSWAAAPAAAPASTAVQVAGVAVDSPHTADRALAGAQATPSPKRLRWLWWTAGSIAVASLAGLCAYLAVVANQWSNRVDELTAISQDLGAQVADESASRDAAEANAATLQSQLDTATARISELANEEANATDHESVWINLVDSYIECEQGWVNHASVLKGQQVYTGTTTARAEAELIAYCNSLESEYLDFKAEIGK